MRSPVAGPVAGAVATAVGGLLLCWLLLPKVQSSLSSIVSNMLSGNIGRGESEPGMPPGRLGRCGTAAGTFLGFPLWPLLRLYPPELA